MTRDEFRKMAYEIRVALGHNYMEQLEEMVRAYEGCTRWNEELRERLEMCRTCQDSALENVRIIEELRAELDEARLWWGRWEFHAKAIGALTDPVTGFTWRGMPMKSYKEDVK